MSALMGVDREVIMLRALLPVAVLAIVWHCGRNRCSSVAGAQLSSAEPRS